MLVKLYHGSPEKRPLLRERAFVSTMLERSAKYARYPSNGEGTHIGYIFELVVDDGDVTWDDKDDCIQGRLKKEVLASRWTVSEIPLDLPGRQSPVKIKADGSCVWSNGESIEWQTMKILDPQTVPTDILAAVARDQLTDGELDRAILLELQARIACEKCPPEDRAAIGKFNATVYMPRFGYTMMPPGIINVPGAKPAPVPAYYRKQGSRVLTNMETNLNEGGKPSIESTTHEPKNKESGSQSGRFSPWTVFTASLSHVPGLKILYAVLAVIAILAMVKVWSLDRGWTVIGAVAIVAFTVLLLVIEKISGSPSSVFHGQARVLTWFCVAMFMIWCSLLTGCVFFKWPVPVSDIPLIPVHKPGGTKLESAPVADMQPTHTTEKVGVAGNDPGWTKIGRANSNTLIRVYAEGQVHFGRGSTDGPEAGVEGKRLFEWIQGISGSPGEAEMEAITKNPASQAPAIKKLFSKSSPAHFNQGGLWIKIVRRNTEDLVAATQLYYYWSNVLNYPGFMANTDVDVYAKAHDGGKTPDGSAKDYVDNTGAYRVWLVLSKPERVEWMLP